METPSGFILIDKPPDWTSHDIVAVLRRITGIKKIGHAGTLDPFATGLLIVGIGRPATKRIDEFKHMPKQYTTTIHLGATSNTQDKTGDITQTPNPLTPPIETIQTTINTFLGKQQQIPPMFSAKKVKGKKLYELARKGIEIERQPNDIEIFSIDLLNYTWPKLQIHVACSTGTYIRTLAHDIGQSLGTGAYCEELRRTAIGDYTVENAQPIKSITADNWQTHLTNPL